ncbi:hypothetical protein MXD61_13825 [Frankia sp. AgPm24]|uniref:hypothetical protein n=1 Tax=Frankia sp. AgPm24 TaxID=631128 RepID=UPI00200DDC5E|nr:hypothetical protein [Frankia sp. AgPm24]MCK9922936.1 hypothetical protein [Frankia sp. AgPm24]
MRAAAQDLRAHPSTDSWTGAEARVPRERRRRAARRVFPATAAVATAAAVAAIMFGATASSRSDPVAVVLASPPAGPTLTAIHFSVAEAAQIPLECSQSGPGKADPARSPTLGMTVKAAVRDSLGISVSVLLGNDYGVSLCQIPINATGRPDILLAYGYGGTTWDSRSPDPVVVDLVMSHGFDGKYRPDELRTVHTVSGRVSSRVGRITVTAPDGRVSDVPIQNGYFLARSVQLDGTPPAGDTSPNGGGQGAMVGGLGSIGSWEHSKTPTIRVFDRGGRLLKVVP